MAKLKASVFIDATALRGLSGVRGIGRYLRDLLTGLATIADTEAPDLELTAITDVTPTGLCTTRDLLAAAQDDPATRSESSFAVSLGRRTLLAPLAAHAGAKLLHLAEIRGTPLVRPIPMVVTCYDLIPLRYPHEYLGEAFVSERFPRLSPGYAVRYLKDSRRYRTASRVVCISERTRRDVLDVLHLPAERVDVVQTGLELARYEPRADRIPTENKLPFAIYVGHADWRKNISGMFEALRLANAKRPIELLWVGGLKADDLAAMKALAATYGVAERVRFLGYVADEDLAGLYQDAVALLFLSRLEGFGLPVLEAMAAGCPAIVARDSAADEVAGNAGFIVSPDDSQAAADKLLSLLENPALRDALVRAGLARAPLYNARDMARGYLASYRKALRATA